MHLCRPMTEQAPVIAIDGPVGTGKGSVSREIAVRFGWHILDSGAIYRLLALGAARNHIVTGDVGGLVALSESLDVHFEPGAESEPARVMLQGADVTDAIRTEAVGTDASRLAGHDAVRAALLLMQRNFRKLPGLVADGRDMGTVVFADAELKIYLTASPEIRAERRHKQLIAKGIDVSVASLLADITARDKRDSERVVAPLKPAEGAVVIDTTGLAIDEVVAQICQHASCRGLNAEPS